MDATLSRSGSQFKLTGPPEDPVRLGWAEFLGRVVWDCFGTHTYKGAGRSPRAFEACQKNFRWWISRVLLREAVLRGLARSWTDDEGRERAAGRYENARRRNHAIALPVWVLGLELHKSGLLHMHSLIKWPTMLPDVRRDAAWKIWKDAYGGARFEPPRSMGVLDYIAKYVIKGGDIVLSPSFDAPRMSSCCG